MPECAAVCLCDCTNTLLGVCEFLVLELVLLGPLFCVTCEEKVPLPPVPRSKQLVPSDSGFQWLDCAPGIGFSKIKKALKRLPTVFSRV